MKSKRFWFYLIGISFALGFIAKGSYIFAKAEVAQWLLNDAWEQTLATGKDHKPWSWADTAPVARLKFAEDSVEMIVLSGISGRTLAFGPGQMMHGAQPGEMGTVVIAGHRDTHFSLLQEVKKGQVIALQNRLGIWFRYRVEQLSVVDSQETEMVEAVGDAQLVLVTCYPFDAIQPGGPLRYLVSARLIAE